jgi:hypothetical protein
VVLDSTANAAQDSSGQTFYGLGSSVFASTGAHQVEWEVSGHVRTVTVEGDNVIVQVSADRFDSTITSTYTYQRDNPNRLSGKVVGANGKIYGVLVQ